MKLGIMQPYFFPYIGYFDLIAGTDRWVVFDVVQYNRKSWMTRNRVLHPTTGWQYINVPVVRKPHGAPISEIEVENREDALARVLGQIEHYRQYAPYFQPVRALIEETFTGTSDRLVDVNLRGLRAVCRYLGLKLDASLCSELSLDFNDVEHAGQWALVIAKQLGASEYRNLPGGQSIFDRAEWEGAGIELSFNDMPELVYDCGPYDWEDNLSVIDVLMWNHPDWITEQMRWNVW